MKTLLFICQPSTWHIGWQQSVWSLLFVSFIKSKEAMSYNLTLRRFLPSVLGFISMKSLFRVCSCTLANSSPSIFSQSGLRVCNLLNPTKACVKTFHFPTPAPSTPMNVKNEFCSAYQRVLRAGFAWQRIDDSVSRRRSVLTWIDIEDGLKAGWLIFFRSILVEGVTRYKVQP